MKYADKQEIRPRSEKSCDFGSGERRVLVRNKKRALLHQARHSYKNGAYTSGHVPTRWVLWTDNETYPRCSKYIHEGRLTAQQLKDLGPKIFEHLGMTFDLALIRTDRTLLLHEPGELTPEPRKRKPPTPRPKLDVPSIYKVALRYNTEDKEHIVLLIFDVVEQRRGVASVQSRLNSRYGQDVRVDKLAESGFYTTAEAALTAFLKAQDDVVAEAERDLRRKQKRLADAIEERDRIVALVRRDLPEIPFPVDTLSPTAAIVGPYMVQVRCWDEDAQDWAPEGLVTVTAQNGDDAKKRALRLTANSEIQPRSALVLVTPDEFEDGVPIATCHEKEWHGTRINPRHAGTCFYCGEPVTSTESPRHGSGPV